MKTFEVSCSADVRWLCKDGSDETSLRVFMKVECQGKGTSIDMTDDIFKRAGVDHLYNGFANIVKNTPPKKVYIDVDQNTGKFIGINGSSKSEWIEQLCEKAGKFMYEYM